MKHYSYWQKLWQQFKQHRLGFFALCIVFVFSLAAIYAPFLASSKPLFVMYDGEAYFPLFRYLFYSNFYTKNLDLFFNLFMFVFPIAGLVMSLSRSMRAFLFFIFLQLALFISLLAFPINDPAANLNLAQNHIQNDNQIITWQHELNHMSPYAKLNLVLDYRLQKRHSQRIASIVATQLPPGDPFLEKIPTIWQMEQNRTAAQIESEKKRLKSLKQKDSNRENELKDTRANIAFIEDRQAWLESQNQLLKYPIMPLVSSFHWEDDAGGSQQLNQYLPWWLMSRINHKSLIAALIFGTRISLVVGLLAVGIALSIAIPVGAIAGFYGGTIDIVISRLLEVWESMPTFFMLLLIVAVTQSKSIFLVISVIGIFGWTSFSRFLRGEFFKQRNLPYVEACQAMGYSQPYIIFYHILPNAIPPLLTLLPFAIMGAIGSESGLSFLGLGEEGSCSWGVLMDEGRSSFPAQSSLLWPPAFLLTALLVAIALVGDALRDTLDPKLHR